MTYQAERTLQITLLDGSRPAEVIHEDRGDGTAVCNIRLRPLEGQEAKFNEAGAGRSYVRQLRPRARPIHGSDPVKVPGLGRAKAPA